jgi:hypothetical protein
MKTSTTGIGFFAANLKLATVKIVAEVLTITPNEVTLLEKKKIINCIGDNKYDLKDCIQKYIRYLRVKNVKGRR